MAKLDEVGPERAARALPPLFPALLVGLFLWNALHFHGYLVDDAFISLRYARNLVAGEGLVYNAGERVEGFSNPTWVALASAALALDLPPLAVLEGIGLASGVAVVLMTSALARRVLVRTGGTRRGVALATGLVAASSALRAWSSHERE